MLKKKIMGTLLVLGSCTACITQAYDYYSIYPGLEMEYKGLTYTCDNNANCTTTDQNDNTFNGLFFTSNNYGSNGRAYAFFYDNNNEGYLSQFRGYIGGTYTYSQRSPIQGCFGTYEKAMGDFHNSSNKVCDWSYNGRDGTGNANTGNTLSWLSDTTLAGKLESIRFSPFGDEIIICYNYGTGTQSFCFISQDNQGSNINYGIDFNTAYGQVFTSKLSLLPTGNSPRAGGGGDDEETPTETTTILGQCPTVREILSTYGSDYNTGICYSATRLLTQTGIVNTEAQSIFELYPTFTGWLADYNYYKQYCENVPSSICREAFSGNEIKWSLLNKTPQDNPIAIYQYCHLQLNIQDKNATTCVLSTGAYYATGVDEAIIDEIQGNQSVLDIMLNSFNNLKDELPSFNSGTVFDEFLEEGETRKDGFKLDIFKTFLELWSKITSIFIFRHQYEGIIPTYITSIIMIILLFKILKK